MEKHPIRRDQISDGEEVSLLEYCRKRKRFFALFLICAALLVAAFAVTYAFEMEDWKENEETDVGTGRTTAGTDFSSDVLLGSTTGDWDIESGKTPSQNASEDKEILEESPQAGVPILSVTFPAHRGEDGYINNESIQTLNGEDWLSYDLSRKVGEDPVVLILHTHTQEGYAEEGATWIRGDVGEATYTKDVGRSVVAVGEVLQDTLNGHGIGTIHCTTVHDADGNVGSYQRSAESIRFFLKLYPSISYVIDLHRDAILTSDGEYVRAIADDSEVALAQVMAVVGSDANGTHHPNWKKNLALAEQLRVSLNQETKDLCRPSILRNASYNQELCTYSLLLEIGTGANSVEEAKRSATLVGNALAELIRK